jgi:serine/threonine protein kinase
MTRGEGSLQHFIEKDRPGRIPASQIRIWVHQIALGLSYMHLLGICHFDVKLPNILYFQGSARGDQRGYHVKVMDLICIFDFA